MQVFKDIKLSNVWAVYRNTYLGERLGDIPARSKTLPGGCIVKKDWTETRPLSNTNIEGLNLYRTELTLIPPSLLSLEEENDSDEEESSENDSDDEETSSEDGSDNKGSLSEDEEELFSENEDTPSNLESAETYSMPLRKNKNPTGKIPMIATHKFIELCRSGPFSTEFHVLHTCKTKGCYAPDHIAVGTISQNMLDRHRDKTMGAKLTADDARAICDNVDRLTIKALAEKYEVSESTISGIRSGESWSHVTGIKKKKRPKSKRKIVKRIIMKETDSWRDEIRKRSKDGEETKLNGPCWNWSGTLNSARYGLICIRGVTFRSHVISLAVNSGKFPKKGQVVRHYVCNNRTCCNPGHLLVGSHGDNMRDRKIHGTAVKSSKLNPEKVLNIVDRINAKESLVSISKFHSMGVSAINRIRDKEIWIEVTRDLKIDMSSKTISKNRAADIKYLISCGYGDELIADAYFVTPDHVKDVRNGTKGKGVEAKLSPEGKRALKLLKKGSVVKEEEKKTPLPLPDSDFIPGHSISLSEVPRLPLPNSTFLSEIPRLPLLDSNSAPKDSTSRLQTSSSPLPDFDLDFTSAVFRYYYSAMFRYSRSGSKLKLPSLVSSLTSLRVSKELRESLVHSTSSPSNVRLPSGTGEDRSDPNRKPEITCLSLPDPG